MKSSMGDGRLCAYGVIAVLGLAAACSGDGDTPQGGPNGSGGSGVGGVGGAGGSSGPSGGGGTGATGGTGSSSIGGSSGAGGGSAGGGPCTLASDWTTVDDYTHPGANQTNPSQLLATADGIYATGISLAAGQATGLLRASANGNEFTLLKALPGIGGDLVRAPNGTWFVTGGDSAGANRTVQRSPDAQTWGIVDTVPLAAGACNVGFLAVTSTGKIYSAGSCDVEGWRVRVSENGGDSWSDVGAVFQLAAGKPARLGDLRVDATDHVYLAGTAQDESQIAHWIIRRLEPDGSFTTVDDFELETGKSGITVALAGRERVYAVGSAQASDGNHWVVRRADATGDTWTTIDNHLPMSSTDATATGLYEGPNGVIVSVGTITDAGGVTSVLTRRSESDGAAWASGEPFRYVASKASSVAGHLVADASGNVYSAVRGVAADDHGHWLIRRMACQR